MAFKVFKGVDQDMEFRGLKAQYLGYMGMVLGGGLLLFLILYAMGSPLIVSLILCVASVFYLSVWVARLNKKWGKDGMMKKQAFRRLPSAIRIHNRGFVKRLSAKQKQSL